MDHRIIERAKQLEEEIKNGQSALSAIARTLIEVYNWGRLDERFPTWGEEINAVQIRGAEKKVRGTSGPG